MEFTVSFLILFNLATRASGGEAEKKLYNILLNDYDPLARPVLNTSLPVVVSLGLTLQQVIDMDEKNQIIETNIWLTMKWVDEFLRWKPSDYDDIEEIRLPATMIWKPDILLYNSVDENFHTLYPTNIIVRSDGEVEWSPPGIVKSACRIDTTFFPFDDQRCSLKYGSWTYSGFLLDLRVGDVVTSTYIESGEWHLKEVLVTRNEFKYDCCPEPYYDVTFTIWIRRKTLYYCFNFIVPCLLISSMTLLDFLLPPESGEKLTIGMTLFMSLCVFLDMIAEALPPTSDAVSLIGTYFACIMTIVSISNVLTVIVLNFHYSSLEAHEVSPLMRTVFLNWLPWLLLMDRPGHHGRRRFRLTKVENSTQKIDTPSISPVTPKKSPASRLSRRLSLSHHDGMARTVSGLENALSRAGKFSRRVARARSKACQRCLAAFGVHDEIVRVVVADIRRNLHVVTARMRIDDEESTVLSDWKFAAIVLDRCSLIIMGAVLVISTSAILLASPHGFA